MLVLSVNVSEVKSDKSKDESSRRVPSEAEVRGREGAHATPLGRVFMCFQNSVMRLFMYSYTI